MKNRKSVYLIIILMIIILGCTSNPLAVDLPSEEVSITYTNIDKQLHNQTIEKVQENVNSLKQELGSLFLYEMSQNIRQNIDDSSYQSIYNFYHSEYISDLEEEKKKLYAHLPQHQKRTNKAFNYLRYHFGDSILPENIFYINKLFSQVTCSPINIAVGLENYISPESEVIKALPKTELHEWQRDRMQIKFLERDILLNWIQVQLFDEMDGKLAEHIVQAGKILYVLNAAFPNESEAYILRYNQKQYSWAHQNEESVWNYLVEQQLLFKTDIRTRTNFLNEGPTTVGLAEGAPDRIGQYLGYRMVKAYMHKNNSLSLPGLLEIKYNTILQSYEIN